MGQQWEDYMDMTLTPPSAEIAKKTFGEILRLNRQDNLDPFRSWNLELEFNRGDGTTIWTEGRIGILRGVDGKHAGLVGIVRDIAERKKSRRDPQTLGISTTASFTTNPGDSSRRALSYCS